MTGLWHKLFNVVVMDWIALGGLTICDVHFMYNFLIILRGVEHHVLFDLFSSCMCAMEAEVQQEFLRTNLEV